MVVSSTVTQYYSICGVYMSMRCCTLYVTLHPSQEEMLTAGWEFNKPCALLLASQLATKANFSACLWIKLTAIYGSWHFKQSSKASSWEFVPRSDTRIEPTKPACKYVYWAQHTSKVTLNGDDATLLTDWSWLEAVCGGGKTRQRWQVRKIIVADMYMCSITSCHEDF